MKKKFLIIGGVVLFAIILGLVLWLIGVFGGSSVVVGEKDLDSAISVTLFALESDKYLAGECRAEGHIVLGKTVEEDVTTVYALTMYGEYSFENNNLVKISGSDAIPAVLKLAKHDKYYTFGGSEIIWPTEGTEYEKSVKEMFPEKYHERVLSISEKDRNKLKEQELEYVKDYLKRIGRTAQIGERKDFEYPLITDFEVSVDVSNKLLARKYSKYPYWIGTKEVVEDGVRYIYERAYNAENSEVVFTQYDCETKAVIEQIKVDTLTAEEKEYVKNESSELKLNRTIGFISEFDKKSKGFKFDKAEWITLADEARISELNIDINNDMPNGYYLYNPEGSTINLKVNDDTIYRFINWSYKYSGDRMHVTNRINEFKEYLDEYKDSKIPFWVEYNTDGSIKSIMQQYVP